MRPESLDLDEWLEDWIPGISRDARGVAVFPTPLRHGVVAEPGLFANDLGAELERFEL